MMHPGKNLLRLLTSTAAAVALMTSAASAALIELTPTGSAFVSDESVKLSDLLGSTPNVMGLLVGDKVFDGFSYNTIGLDMPNPADIDVLGFRDTQGNWGIRLHGVFRDRPGGGESDAFISFNVEIAPLQQQRGWLITDAHLAIQGYGLGDDSEFYVDETIQGVSPSGGSAIPGMSVGVTTLGSGFEQATDETVFDRGYTKIRVTKDVLAFAADNANQSVRTTIIDQSFSQIQIPEPAAGMMAVLACLAGTTARRRR